MSNARGEAGAVRKRQKIQDSSKQMFLWVAGMSAAVGIALVVSWFLWNQIAFKTKVVSAKNDTVRTLRANNQVAPQLRDNIRVLETNTALAEAKAQDDQRALQVILDALPADANSLALGASLQNRLARNISGLTIESLTVAPTSEEQWQAEDSTAAIPADEGLDAAQSRIQVTLTATSRDATALNEFLQRLERSIRVIDIERLTMERSTSEYTLNVVAHGYYQPAREITLKTEVVQP